MKSRIIWCLIGVNIALAVVFVIPRLNPNAAMAQGAGRPADYLLVPGTVIGTDRGVVYIIDSSNGLMSALAYDDAAGRIVVMQPSDLLRVFEETPEALGPGGVNPRRR